MANSNEPKTHVKHVKNEQEAMDFVERFSETHDVIGHTLNNLNPDDLVLTVSYITHEEG